MRPVLRRTATSPAGVFAEQASSGTSHPGAFGFAGASPQSLPGVTQLSQSPSGALQAGTQLSQSPRAQELLPAVGEQKSGVAAPMAPHLQTAPSSSTTVDAAPNAAKARWSQVRSAIPETVAQRLQTVPSTTLDAAPNANLANPQSLVSSAMGQRAVVAPPVAQRQTGGPVTTSMGVPLSQPTPTLVPSGLEHAAALDVPAPAPLHTQPEVNVQQTPTGEPGVTEIVIKIRQGGVS